MSLFDLLDKARRKAGEVWTQADRAVGGWLPGGGIASPLTKAVFVPQSYPDRSAELERITGVKGRIIDPTKTPSLVRRVAPAISPRWGDSDYANPLLNEIGISGYQGGSTPRERQVEFHELGHLNPKDKQLYSYFGTLGRGLQGLSSKTGNLPPLDLLSGLALQHADAPEEDRAERFARQYAQIGDYGSGPIIAEDGTSSYGDRLRREGKELVDESIERMTNPFGITSKVTQFLTEQRAKPARAKFSELDTKLNQVFEKNPNVSFETLPPETKKLIQERLRVMEELKNIGVDPYQ